MELPKKTPKKGIEIVDLTEPTDYLLNKNQQEYAGEGEHRNRFNAIVEFKLTGAYPDFLINYPNKKIKNKRIKEFLMTAHNYILTTEKISPLSRSKLCFRDVINNSLLVIPFKSEISSILKTLHIENGVHLTRDPMRERAKIYKLKWPGYVAGINAYLKDCMCKSIKKELIYQRSNF